MLRRAIPKKPSGHPDLCLNAELLVRLQRALSGHPNTGVKLWLPKEELSAIYVEPTATHEDDDPDAFGVIMSMRP